MPQKCRSPVIFWQELSFLAKKSIYELLPPNYGPETLFLFSGGPDLLVLQSETKRGAGSRRPCKIGMPVPEHVLHCDPFGTVRKADVDFAVQNA